MDDRSFVRFGGLAAVLLALTSWAAVLFYGAVVTEENARITLQIFQLLYALVAFWSLFAVVAVYYRARAAGEAWALFATLVGVVAAAGTMVGAIHELANLRQTPPLTGVSPVDPVGILSFGLTGLWFLIANLLLWRIAMPRLLVIIGFVAAADLFVGFFASLSEAAGTAYYASLIAGAVGGPIYWLWIGRQLRRMP